VIRGPGASIYGNNAFFAVINVVTKRGHQLGGVEVAGSTGNFGSQAGRTSWGQRFGNGLEALFSATVSNRSGERLYFKEFDAPETNHGITAGTDDESSDRQFLSLSMKGAFFTAARVSREKGIPTGAFATDFNDPRNRTTDETTLVQLGYEGSLGSELTTVGRLHYGRYAYTGTYIYTGIDTRDLGRGEWWGFDWNGSWSGLSRQVLTFGGEYQDNVRQDQTSFDVDPRQVWQDTRRRSSRWGLFLQDKVTLAKGLRLHAGLRHDRYDTFGGHTSPRLGLVADFSSATTVKLLYGTAFRAPNEYELHYEAYDYVPNPNLRPETIRTLEGILERRLGRDARISASVFHNDIEGLISFVVDPGISQFRNAGTIHSRGLELAAEARHGRATARASYSLQKTTEGAGGAELTNSPRHMAKLDLGLPLPRGLSSGLETQCISARRTLAGHGVDGFLLANVTLRAPRLFGRVDASAGVYNLFDTRYADPGSEEHLPDSIPQPRRNFRLKVAVRF
jgi:iron complex outermembrane receptor protein